jgi:hypothetical protein
LLLGPKIEEPTIHESRHSPPEGCNDEPHRQCQGFAMKRTTTTFAAFTVAELGFAVMISVNPASLVGANTQGNAQGYAGADVADAARMRDLQRLALCYGCGNGNGNGNIGGNNGNFNGNFNSGSGNGNGNGNGNGAPQTNGNYGYMNGGTGNIGSYNGLGNSSSTSGNNNVGFGNGNNNGGTYNGNGNIGAYNGNYNGVGNVGSGNGSYNGNDNIGAFNGNFNGSFNW